jgi:hypothetical protein
MIRTFRNGRVVRVDLLRTEGTCQSSWERALPAVGQWYCAGHGPVAQYVSNVIKVGRFIQAAKDEQAALDYPDGGSDSLSFSNRL